MVNSPGRVAGLSPLMAARLMETIPGTPAKMEANLKQGQARWVKVMVNPGTRQEDWLPHVTAPF